MKGLRPAIRTLTVLPIRGGENETLADSLYWFAGIGFWVGFFLFLFGSLWRWSLPSPWPLGGAVLMVALEIGLTRGLHMDGLADWADSIGGFGRQKRLAIMKDVSVGGLWIAGADIGHPAPCGDFLETPILRLPYLDTHRRCRFQGHVGGTHNLPSLRPLR